jgi:hypothetical protein
MKTTGFIVYEGPSLIGDGAPIVGILTLDSANEKTGNMLQLWILPVERSPLDAMQSNDNSAICGNCPLQGWFDTDAGKMIDRVCYVNVGQAPEGIWRKYWRDGYPNYVRRTHEHYLEGREIRLGAYGDPAALPVPLLRYLTEACDSHTGYSHQLFSIPRNRADKVAEFCMCSCENTAQHNEALRRGWRAFTVIRPDQPAPAKSVECPFYSHGVKCIDCGLCKGSGMQAKSVYVIAHAKTGLNLSAVQDRATENTAI